MRWYPKEICSCSFILSDDFTECLEASPCPVHEGCSPDEAFRKVWGENKHVSYGRNAIWEQLPEEVKATTKETDIRHEFDDERKVTFLLPKDVACEQKFLTAVESKFQELSEAHPELDKDNVTVK